MSTSEGPAFDDEQPFAASGRPAGVVICQTRFGFHAGVCMVGADGRLSAVHLGWQDKLYEGWSFAVALWVVPQSEPEKLRAAAALCRRVIRRFRESGRFPYALRFAGTTFAPDGTLQLAPGSHGLTCATFVVAVFATCGVVLVEESTWPPGRPEVREWLEQLRSIAKPDHFALLESELGADLRALRPDEVAASCLCPSPAAFSAVSAPAALIRQRLASRPSC